MQVQPGDRVKAVILVVAILGVMVFVLKTAIFRGGGTEAQPPVAVNNPPPVNPTPSTTTMNPPAPQVSVSDGVPPVAGTVQGVNPFRKTVAEKGSGTSQGNGGTTVRPPKPIDGTGPGGEIKPLPGPTTGEAEFRLAGVLIAKRPVAIVSRGGEGTRFLHVGSPAAYGYKVAEIRPNGIRVTQKSGSKWIRVGERLNPPAMPDGMGTTGMTGSNRNVPYSPSVSVDRIPDLPQANEPVAEGWLTDLGEAKAIAKKSGKKIFVDFMATWCGPCKRLDAEVLRTAEFKKYMSKVVLLRVDVDAQPRVAQSYKVTAMPTQMVLRADGSVVRSTVGYGGPNSFYSFLNSALGA